MLPNLKAVGTIEAELHILKVEKLDACIRPLFANSVTYVDLLDIYNNSKVLTALTDLQHYQPHSHLLLMGDVNLPNIDWVNNTVSGGDSAFASQFFNVIQNALLIKHSLEPTQHRPILDF